MEVSASLSRGLLNDIDFLCGTDATSYPTEDKIRNINQSYHEVSRLIREVEYGWQYDDINATDFPIATTSLVHGQQDYELPDGAQGVEKVEVLNDIGDYHKLIQMDWHDITIAMSEFQERNGFPQYYDLIGDSVFLYPAPSSADVTTAAGLKMYFSRDITELVTTATTATPGFATPYHRILSLDAAIIFEEDAGKTNKWIRMRDGLVESMKKFYSGRNVERSRMIKPYAKKYFRQYE